ncbi:hypothetical protein ACIRFF_07445 [Streptomyces cyaneofuscatus]
MAQVFIGLQGGGGRDGDLDFTISLLASLWDPNAPVEVFSRAVSALDNFPEMQPTETGLTGISEIYSFYAVLVMRYAALCRANGDIDSALKYGHACLTAMGQLDQNLPRSSFSADEFELQRRIALAGNEGVLNEEEVRSGDRRIGGERLSTLRERMR